MEIEQLKTGYEQLQISSSAERFDLHDKIYKLRNELQDSKDHMAAEQIVLGPLNVKSCRCRSTWYTVLYIRDGYHINKDQLVSCFVAEHIPLLLFLVANVT